MKHHRSMIALVDEYLAARRALGFALRIEGGQLHAFARYADARRAYQKAIEADPGNATARNGMSRLGGE